MKKNLLTATAIIIAGFTTTAQAQQGRVGVNTNTPAATLDVVANIADATRPDALLVPRMTRAELEAKNNAYGASQNGALVFIASVADGTGTGQTANVTATGFYYYDAPNSIWVSIRGSGGAVAAQRYEAIRGNVTTVNQNAYTIAPTDNVVITVFNASVTITLPALTNTPADIGRVIKIINNNTTNTALAFNGAPALGNLTVNQNRGIEFVWTGNIWSSPQK